MQGHPCAPVGACCSSWRGGDLCVSPPPKAFGCCFSGTEGQRGREWGGGDTPVPILLPVGTPGSRKVSGGTRFPPAAGGSWAGKAWLGPHSTGTRPTAPGALVGGGTRVSPGAHARSEVTSVTPRPSCLESSWQVGGQRGKHGGYGGWWAPPGDMDPPPNQPVAIPTGSVVVPPPPQSQPHAAAKSLCIGERRARRRGIKAPGVVGRQDPCDPPKLGGRHAEPPRHAPQ